MHVDRQPVRIIAVGVVRISERTERYLRQPADITDGVIRPFGGAVVTGIQLLLQTQPHSTANSRLAGNSQCNAVIKRTANEGAFSIAGASGQTDSVGINNVGMLFKDIDDTTDLSGLCSEVSGGMVGTVKGVKRACFGTAAA